MKPLYKGIAIAVVQILIVCSIGGKLLYDRHTRPRVWVRAASFDPSMPVRGRYVALALEPETDLQSTLLTEHRGEKMEWRNCRPYFADVGLSDRNGRLFASTSPRVNGEQLRFIERGDACKAQLSDPVLYFIPELADDPSRRDPLHEQLWVEVTVPKKGPPRPIQLAVSRDGEWRVLTVK